MQETSKEIIQKQINFYNNRISSLLLNFSEDKIRNFDNHLLSKIFEYYACIILTEKYKRIFECYDFILPDKKLELQLSSNDNGIDLCDLENTICQVKLYSNCITWKCLSTFLAQQVGYDNERKEAYVKWKNMFLFRNEESHLSNKFPENSIKIMKQELCKRSDFIEYIVDLVNKGREEVKKEVKCKSENKEKKKLILRKYQKECKDILINSNKENVVLCLPTGTGKTLICISYIKSILNSNIVLEGIEDMFLILVPTCQLLDQWYKEIIRFYAKPKDICRIDHEYSYDLSREYKIYICVYNSISKVLEKVKAESFKKIIIDEAHHIRKPEIYKEEDEEEYYDEDDEGGEGDEYDEGDDESIHSSSLSSYVSSSKTSSSSNISFADIISKLRKYNNVIEISATIDKPISGLYYKYDLRRAIDEGYISDYQIIIPIFSDHPDDSVIAKYLIRNGVNHCIIFSKCKEEGKKFQTLMNETLENCCSYIDSDTKRRDRERILKDFEQGKIRFIVNIRILSEGFNSIIAESCVFLHMSSNDTFIIQSIGRILRKSEKKISNVYLPYLNSEEGDNINRIIRIMSDTDYKLNEQYKKKSIGGMINLNYIKEGDEKEEKEESDEEEVEEDKEENDILHKYDIIYNSFGEMDNKYIELWRSRLEKVKDYINKEKKRPSSDSKDEDIKRLGKWLHHQVTNYNKKQNIMKNEEIRTSWEEFITDDRYKEIFISNEEVWRSNLEKVKEYIERNGKRPSCYSKDEDIKRLSSWITVQVTNYKKKQNIMKNEEIRTSWEEFITDDRYKEIFISNEEVWRSNLEKVKEYIDRNGKRPSKDSKDEDIKWLGTWLNRYVTNYKKKQKIMKNEEIRNEFEEFITDDRYKELFLSNEEEWRSNLEKVKEYIDRNGERPSCYSKDEDIKRLGKWLQDQLTNYKKKQKIMKNKEIRNEFEEFITANRYKEIFISNEEVWRSNLEKVKEYIDRNGKRPSKDSKDEDIKRLGIWFCNHIINYKKKKYIMKDENIRLEWQNLIESYPHLFNSS